MISCSYAFRIERRLWLAPNRFCRFSGFLFSSYCQYFALKFCFFHVLLFYVMSSFLCMVFLLFHYLLCDILLAFFPSSPCAVDVVLMFFTFSSCIQFTSISCTFLPVSLCCCLHVLLFFHKSCIFHLQLMNSQPKTSRFFPSSLHGLLCLSCAWSLMQCI